MSDSGNPDYFYGVQYLGRDTEITWHEHKADALAEVTRTDQKYLPAQLVRMRKMPVENSGLVYDFYDNYKTLEWRQIDSPSTPATPVKVGFVCGRGSNHTVLFGDPDTSCSGNAIADIVILPHAGVNLGGVDFEQVAKHLAEEVEENCILAEKQRWDKYDASMAGNV